MTLTHLALISIGHIVLAGTFVLGVLVGISMKRKESLHGYGNEGTQGKGSQWWHDIERRRFEEVAGRCRSGGCGSRREARPGERAPGERNDDGDRP
jgi:hypothetical protein